MPNEIPSRFPKDDYERVAELDIPPAGHRIRRHSSGLDQGTKRLAIIAGGIGGALVLIVGAWSLAGHRNQTVPVLEAQTGPVRVKPDNPGGMQVTGADETILSGGAPGKENEALAPPPEAPEPKALQAQREADHAKPAPQLPTAGTPGASSPPVATAPSALPLPAVPAKPALPARTTGPEHASTTATASPPKTLPPHVSAPAAALPPAVPGKIATATHAPERDAIPERRTVAAGRANEVQLAALQSEEAAKTEWERLAKRMPGLFNGRHPLVVRAEHDGHTFWRLRTGGFGDVGQATQFCEHVRAKGGGCSVASF